MRTRRPTSPAGNVPAALTSFVGRRREISAVRQCLEQARLVTLTGVGGVGKTRLAVEIATEIRQAFDAGVALVDLASVEDGADVAQAVVDVFELVDQSLKRPIDKLVDQLADGRVLLILDNCEHLREACAEFVHELLRRTRQVRVLATSRRALRIAGEYIFVVPPLSVPDPEELGELEFIEDFEAVRLLTDRARALLPDFAITEVNRRAAARVCAQLDGVPLVIELAAARLRTLSLDELAERLVARFAVLTSGSPVAPVRQRTLRGLVDWSHSLCTEAEQALWARLSVFVGTFALDAVEAVCSGAGLARSDLLDLLDGLVAQSIVVTYNTDGGTRFRLLETVREYGQQRLAALGGAATLRIRHRDFYLGLAKASVTEWCGPGQAERLARLRAEQGNLRAALEYCLADPAGSRAAVEFTAALGNHWCVGGFLAEGRRWLDQALDLPDQVPRARVHALWVAACVCLPQGDWEAAERRLGECDRLAMELGDRTAAARSTSLRATAELSRGNLSVAIDMFDRAAATFRAAGETHDLLVTMFQLAISLSHAGDSERATSVGTRALALSRSRGERLSRSYILWARGFNEWRYGDPDSAMAWTHEALAIQRDFHNPVGSALMIELLAWIAASEGDADAAARLLGAAASVWAGIGATISAFGAPLAVHHARCEEQIRLALGPRNAADAPNDRCRSVAEAITLALGYGRPTRLPGANPPQGGDLRKRVPDQPLTGRELEVAQLVAQGLSNRAIAAALVLSPRTVEGHVDRIRAKLGFDSRTQVAIWMATQPRSALRPLESS